MKIDTEALESTIARLSEQEPVAADGDVYAHYNSMADEDLNASIAGMSLDIREAEEAAKETAKAFKSHIKAVKERYGYALAVKKYRRECEEAGVVPEGPEEEPAPRNAALRAV